MGRHARSNQSFRRYPNPATKRVAQFYHSQCSGLVSTFTLFQNSESQNEDLKKRTNVSFLKDMCTNGQKKKQYWLRLHIETMAFTKKKNL